MNNNNLLTKRIVKVIPPPTVLLQNQSIKVFELFTKQQKHNSFFVNNKQQYISRMLC